MDTHVALRGLGGEPAETMPPHAAQSHSGGERTPPSVTVAVCTHNRSHQLERLLDYLAGALAVLAIKLVVVDSASRPDEAYRIRKAVAKHPNVEFFREDTPGVSLARNVALAAATTTWLAFVDDDEIPEPGWCEALVAIIRRLPSNCGGCGGDVLPDPGSAVAARQLGQRWHAYLSLIRQDGEFDQSTAPCFGIGHSVMRIAALKEVGGFDLRLGRDGASLLSGEEVLLIGQMIERNWRIWHSDRLRVTHSIEPERLERDWARKRAFWEGVSCARVRYITRPEHADHHLILLTRLRCVVLAVLSLTLRGRFEFDLRLALSQGVLHERLAEHRRRHEPSIRPDRLHQAGGLG